MPRRKNAFTAIRSIKKILATLRENLNIAIVELVGVDELMKAHENDAWPPIRSFGGMNEDNYMATNNKQLLIKLAEMKEQIRNPYQKINYVINGRAIPQLAYHEDLPSKWMQILDEAIKTL